MGFVIFLALFPILYLMFGKYALLVLAAGIAWKFTERLSNAGRKPAKRGKDAEPQYQAGYEN